MTYQTTFDVPVGRPDLTITRRFDAAPSRVFAAHVDAELIPRWWGPRYLVTTVERLDAVPGGLWHYVQRAPDGTVHDFHGFFHLVEVSRHLVSTFEYRGTPGQVIMNDFRFEDDGGGTRLVQTSVHVSVSSRDAMLEVGMKGGVLESMERIEELLATPTP